MIRILMVLYSIDYHTPLGNDKRDTDREGVTQLNSVKNIAFDTYFRSDVIQLRRTLHVAQLLV